MATLSRFQKIALIGLGAVSGSLTYYQIGNNQKKFDALNSWTTNYKPSVKWDSNWDHCSPQSLVKPPKSSSPEDQNNYNERLKKAKSKHTRHILLVRHGKYNTEGETEYERTLTDLGKAQADLTGQRLAEFNFKWDHVVSSTMVRAAETANIILKHLPENQNVRYCQLLEEGAPVPPEPPTGDWKPENKQFFQDSVRIEAAFRRYFFRAPPEQVADSYTLLVCHANVIRYFVCKALQLPPEAWLRMSLNHGSITWISILPSGNVVIKGLGDTGHMKPQYISCR